MKFFQVLISFPVSYLPSAVSVLYWELFYFLENENEATTIATNNSATKNAVLITSATVWQNEYVDTQCFIYVIMSFFNNSYLRYIDGIII